MTATLQIKRNKYYVVLNWTQGGKRQLKWVGTGLSSTGNNKRKAEELRKQTLTEWEAKITENYTNISFSDYMLQWLEEIKYSIAETTYSIYELTVKNTICPYFNEKNIKLTDLKPYHIQDFYHYKMKNDGVGANTIRHYHANIRKALATAMKAEKIKDNPADKGTLPKKEKFIGDYLTADELKIVIKEVRGTKLEPVVLLAAWLGLRRGEILGLKWKYIDIEYKTLSVRGTLTVNSTEHRFDGYKYNNFAKNETSIRTFPLTDEMVNYFVQLKTMQEKQRIDAGNCYNQDWLEFVCIDELGKLLSLDYVSRAFPILCEKCGVKKVRLHDLRHTNATLLLEEGIDIKEIQAWLGHSSLSTTANIYAHVQAKAKIKLAQTMGNLLNDD